MMPRIREILAALQRWAVAWRRPGADRLDMSGHVRILAHHPNGWVEETDLGKNRLTRAFRVLVARVLARTSANVGSVTFSTGTEGLTGASTLFPAYLYIGEDNTAASEDDTRLGRYVTSNETYPDAYAVPLRFPLARIYVHDAPGDYDTDNRPIQVAFEFDIPVGTLRSGGDAELAPILIREWGLHATDGGDTYPIEGNPASVDDPQVSTGSPPTLLARRVVDLPKIPELSLTVRWEIWV